MSCAYSSGSYDVQWCKNVLLLDTTLLPYTRLGVLCVVLLVFVLCLFQGRLQSQDSGKHLHDVLDLLQKHTLVEADISAQAERIKAVQGAANRFTSYEQGKCFFTSFYKIG